MGTKKKFTPEELKHLQANPNTLRVRLGRPAKFTTPTASRTPPACGSWALR